LQLFQELLNWLLSFYLEDDEWIKKWVGNLSFLVLMISEHVEMSFQYKFLMKSWVFTNQFFLVLVVNKKIEERKDQNLKERQRKDEATR
jgi:hypothetical protein